MKSAGKARSNGLYRHIRTSKEIIRNLLNDFPKNNTEKILSSINNHVMILTTLFIILFTTRRGCDGNSKRSFDPSYR